MITTIVTTLVFLFILLVLFVSGSPIASVILNVFVVSWFVLMVLIFVNGICKLFSVTKKITKKEPIMEEIILAIFEILWGGFWIIFLISQFIH